MEEIPVYIFSLIGEVRFTEEGALRLAQEKGYKDLEHSYKEEFHYFTEMTPEDLDNFIE
jgi:hypothetical protein